MTPWLSAGLALLTTFVTVGRPATAEGAPTWPPLEESAARAVGGGGKDAALIVAIEDYATLPKVRGARLNGIAWHAYLTKTRGIPAARVHLIKDADAALEKLQDQVKWATKQVRPGGTLWFVFIGHGAPAASGDDGLLVGWDAQPDSGSVNVRSLRREAVVRQMAGHGAHRVLILDACFSGRLPDGGSVFGPEQPAFDVTLQAVDSADVLVAAGQNQTAGPLPGAGPLRPAFSYLVLGGLRGWADGQDGGKRDGRITAGEAVHYARSVIEALAPARRQTPEANHDDAILARSPGETGPDILALMRVEPEPDRAPPPRLDPPAPPPVAPAPTAKGGGFENPWFWVTGASSVALVAVGVGVYQAYEGDASTARQNATQARNDNSPEVAASYDSDASLAEGKRDTGTIVAVCGGLLAGVATLIWFRSAPSEGQVGVYAAPSAIGVAGTW